MYLLFQIQISACDTFCSQGKLFYFKDNHLNNMWAIGEDFSIVFLDKSHPHYNRTIKVESIHNVSVVNGLHFQSRIMSMKYKVKF